VGLQVRQTAHDAGRGITGPGSLHGDLCDSMHGRGPSHELSASGRLSPRFGASTGGGLPSSGGRGTPMGRVDGEMMSLLRRLSHGAQAMADSGGSDFGGYVGGGYGEAGSSGVGMLMAPNLIVAHREELRQAATGALDHMVIDVIAGLFDQILSDPKVPPQMARQLARLQLPVLRAALGDSSFFSSRKHPVRRFINRIASLGTAVDDFDGDEGRSLLARVRELVEEIVEGDFEQIELYEQKLNDLEAFIQQQSKAQLESKADEVLGRKENQLRVQHKFAQQLDGALHALPVPEFLREFLGHTWSRVIAQSEIGRAHV
jgi:hypothetical protein